MRNLSGLLIVAAVLFTGAWACNVSTANLSSLTTSKDKEGTQQTTTFKAGDTIYATAAVSNNPGKVTLKIYLAADDAPGLKKGEVLTNSEVKLDVDGDNVAKYNYPTFPTAPNSKFNLVADMLNEAGEKKDSKSVAITLQGGSSSSSSSHEDDK